MNQHLDTIQGNLRRYGGSGDLKKYAPVGEKKHNGRWIKLCQLKPHYKTLRFVEFDCEAFVFEDLYHKCMCGKKDIINFHWIQRQQRENDPLLIIGSCCIKKFMEKENDTFYHCATCNKFYKSGKYTECKDCRMKREGKVCTFCGDPTNRKTKICNECDTLNDDYERASVFNRKRIMKNIFSFWKNKTTFNVPCRLCNDEIPSWKARKRDGKCWTCYCIRPFE